MSSAPVHTSPHLCGGGSKNRPGAQTGCVGAIAQGDDPAQVRQHQLHEPTFGDLTEQYLERHAPRKRSARDDRGMLETHLTVFRTQKLTDLSRNDVARLHAKIGATAPSRANSSWPYFGRCSIWLGTGASISVRIRPHAFSFFERNLAIGSCGPRNSPNSFRPKAGRPHLLPLPNPLVACSETWRE